VGERRSTYDRLPRAGRTSLVVSAHKRTTRPRCEGSGATRCRQPTMPIWGNVGQPDIVLPTPPTHQLLPRGKETLLGFSRWTTALPTGGPPARRIRADEARPSDFCSCAFFCQPHSQYGYICTYVPSKHYLPNESSYRAEIWYAGPGSPQYEHNFFSETLITWINSYSRFCQIF
jgi:hypothetical protein